MRMKRYVMVLAAVALPISTVALLEGTAVAKTALGTGAVTCSVGGSVSFSPPLTPAGTSASKEVVTVSLTASHCSGGTPPQTSGSITTKALKIKATKSGKSKIAGSCASFGTSAKTVTVKSKWAWSGAKPSKTTIVGLNEAINGAGEVGFTAGSFATSGSYSGAGSAGVYFNTASSNAILGCVADTSSSPVSGADHRPCQQHDHGWLTGIPHHAGDHRVGRTLKEGGLRPTLLRARTQCGPGARGALAPR